MQRLTPLRSAVLVSGGLVAVAVGAASAATPRVTSPATPTVPAACFSMPTSTGGSHAAVGYCPAGSTPRPVPVTLPSSACVPVTVLGPKAQAGYCLPST